MDRITYRDEKNRAFYTACKNCNLPEKSYEAGAGSPCNGCYQELVRCSKLADYEDAEEDGSLVRFPAKLGSPLYAIDKFNRNIGKFTVEGYKITSRGIYFDVGNGLLFNTAKLGKELFLTREQAEKEVKNEQSNICTGSDAGKM